MIKDNNKNQKGAEKSTNIQADNVNIYNTLSYSDVKSIATDIFESNFIKLRDQAANCAIERVEEFTEKILKSLEQKNLESLDEFKEPGMQEALYVAQKEYAKSGDEDLGDLLVDIIVDRAETSERNMLQIVLDEALLTAPKITVEQLDTLTLIFLLINTITIFNDFEHFKEYLEENIFPFVVNLQIDNEHYKFLEYLRCGHIRAGSYGKFEDFNRKLYTFLFSKGFTLKDLKSNIKDYELIKHLLVPSFHDKDILQFGVINHNYLNSELMKLNLSKQSMSEVKSFYGKSILKPNEIKNLLVSLDKRMEKIVNVWENSYFNKFELSSMGIAIAHANYRRRTGDTFDLSLWIK